MDTTKSTRLEADTGRPLASVSDFFSLLKPRVMSLVVFTGLVGMVLSDGGLHPILAAISIFAIALGAGASGAINQWYDRDMDAVMERTKKRPIPAGRMDPDEALGFGVVVGLFSVLMLSLASNFMAGGLLAFTIFFYVVIYTIWLKRRTPQNIVIGGAAGALPPMVGWAAMTGEITLQSLTLFAIIFFWTPPHFWALALVRNEDYRRANVPMLPVQAGAPETRKQILIYAVIMAAIGLLPVAIGMSGMLYGALALLLGLRFIQLSYRLFKSASDDHAMGLFKFSILYLFLLFAALPVDKWLGPALPAGLM